MADKGRTVSANSGDLLSKLVHHRTYAKRLNFLNRKETPDETIMRVMNMHIDRFPNLADQIVKAFGFVMAGKILPSMRAMQYAGTPILKNNCRQYNCSYLPIDDVTAFSEVLFLLLSGCGVGFSVQHRHAKHLPKVGKPKQHGKFIIQDSIMGWAQALDALVKAYFHSSILPEFDYSQITPKGVMLTTTGSPAPGPIRLMEMLDAVKGIFEANVDKHLKSLTIHDLVCTISDCVVSGGVRRAALISLFDADDDQMLKAKTGDWYIKHPYRARANNSAILPRYEIRGQDGKDKFMNVFNMCAQSGSGEPGICLVNDPDMGYNPCNEASLRRNTFCNLTTINQASLLNKSDLIEAAVYASFIGTLQASYTDFPFLRDCWRKNTEEDALLGVSFTGIGDAGDRFSNEDLQHAAYEVVSVNKKYAAILGINIAARTTMLKPEGSSSCVLKTSSGIGPRKGKHYIRRVQINNTDPLLQYLNGIIPELIEPAYGVNDTSVISIPESAPDDALLEASDDAFSLFSRIMKYNKYWIAPGHNRGSNRHNVSATLSVKPEEWQPLGEMMWDNIDNFSSIAMFPHDNGIYKQAPFELCTEEHFNKLSQYVKDIDLSNVPLDSNIRQESIACAGNACEVVSLE